MDLGAIVFRFQTAGGQVFKRELRDADAAVDKLGASSQKGAKQVDGLGKETDAAGKAASKAKGGLDAAAKGAENLGDESDKGKGKVKGFRSEISGMSDDAKSASTLVGGSLVGVGAAAATMVGLSVAKFAEFDEGMSRVGAATMASEKQLDQLGDAAVEAGAKTVFNAREAADAQTELAKAGVSVNDILAGGLNGSLALAAAGELEVARAAEIAATTLSVFKLGGEQAGHVADLLAAGAGKAQGSVDDLALALNYIGPTFARANIPIEDTVGVLGLLASQGILGEKAGTGLRATMQALLAPTQAAAKAMAANEISVRDAKGEFIGMDQAAQVLHDRLGRLDAASRDAALGAIFGAEAANVAGTLYEAGGAGVREWTNNVNDSGYAAEQAARMTDNLQGDVEQLGGAFDSALIKTGEHANGVLRGMVQVLTNLVDFYNSLDPAAQGTALAIGVATAAITLSTGAFLLLIPKIAEYRTAMATLSKEMPRTAAAARGLVGALGPISLVLTLAGVALAAFAGDQAASAAKVEELTATLDAQTGAFTENTRAAVAKRIQDSNGFEVAKRAGVSQKELTDAMIEGGDAAAQVVAKIRAYHKELGLDEFPEMLATSKLIDTITDLPPELDRAKEAHDNLAAATDGAADSSSNFTNETQEVTEAVDGVVTSLQDMYEELMSVNDGQLSAREAARNLEAAYDDFDATVKKNGRTLDITTQKGRENQDALDAIARAAMNSGQKILDAGGSTDEYRQSLINSRKQLLDRIHDLGVQGQEAEDLADSILQIPTERDVKIQVDADRASQMVANFKALLATIPGSKMTSVGVSAMPNNQGYFTLGKADGGTVDYYAGGGIRENHVAQIAAAGTMRVWAEPETGGEAYIPLSPAKRARSLEIWAETGRRLGVPGFDDGGITGGAKGLRPITVNVYGAPGQDEDTLADRAVSKLERALR